MTYSKKLENNILGTFTSSSNSIKNSCIKEQLAPDVQRVDGIIHSIMQQDFSCFNSYLSAVDGHIISQK